MKAKDAMVPDPHVAVAGAMASEVAIMLKTRNISVVPVVDDHRTRRFLGTLSDRDLVTRCLAEGKHPWLTRADSMMRTRSAVMLSISPAVRTKFAFSSPLPRMTLRLAVNVRKVTLPPSTSIPWPTLSTLSARMSAVPPVAEICSMSIVPTSRRIKFAPAPLAMAESEPNWLS
jgi:CBS domain-containing protein